MWRWLNILLVCGFLWMPLQSRAESPEKRGQDELAAYLHMAATNNQQLQAAFERWKAAAEQVHQEGYLPEPKLSLSYYLQPVQTRAGDQRFAIGLAQSFPWFGTLSLQEQRAALEADARKALLDDVAMAVFNDVKQTYYEYAYLGQAIQLSKDILELLVFLEEVTQTRYEAGLAEYDGLIRLQVEIATLEDRIRSLEDLRPALVAALNAAMHRPPHTDIPWPPPLSASILAMQDKAVMELVRTASPQLAANRLRIQKADAGVQLARKQYYPSFTLSLSSIVTDVAQLKRAQSVNGNTVNTPATRTTEDAGMDPLVAGLQVSLPLWYGKYAAGEREAKAEKRAAQADEAALLDSLQSNLRMVLVQYRDAVRQAALYDTSLAPKATQALEATVDAYQAGVATVSDLFEAERTLLEFRLAHVRALANQAQRIAQAERLVGQALPITVTNGTAPASRVPSLSYQIDASTPRPVSQPSLE